MRPPRVRRRAQRRDRGEVATLCGLRGCLPEPGDEGDQCARPQSGRLVRRRVRKATRQACRSTTGSRQGSGVPACSVVTASRDGLLAEAHRYVVATQAHLAANIVLNGAQETVDYRGLPHVVFTDPSSRVGWHDRGPSCRRRSRHREGDSAGNGRPSQSRQGGNEASGTCVPHGTREGLLGSPGRFAGWLRPASLSLGSAGRMPGSCRYWVPRQAKAITMPMTSSYGCELS
jgi:hypothetical protein